MCRVCRRRVGAGAAHGARARGGGGGRLGVQAAPAHAPPHGRLHRAAAAAAGNTSHHIYYLLQL